MALPAKGESLAVFQRHDATCHAYASARTRGQTPGQSAAKSGIAGAALGTGLGAAAGAPLGSVSGHAGGGAAVGAGTGLVAGSLLGSAAGRHAAAATQDRYNVAYTQCMVANGEHIVPPARTRPVCSSARPAALESADRRRATGVLRSYLPSPPL
jgi:Glycine-zipper domain